MAFAEGYKAGAMVPYFALVPVCRHAGRRFNDGEALQAWPPGRTLGGSSTRRLA
jgi:hypothetical protein